MFEPRNGLRVKAYEQFLFKVVQTCKQDSPTQRLLCQWPIIYFWIRYVINFSNGLRHNIRDFPGRGNESSYYVYLNFVVWNCAGNRLRNRNAFTKHFINVFACNSSKLKQLRIV